MRWHGGRANTHSPKFSLGRSVQREINFIDPRKSMPTCQHQIEELLTELIHVAGRRDRGQFLDPIQIQSSARRLFLGCVTGGCSSGEFIQPRKSLLADLCKNPASCPSHPKLRYVNGLHFRLLLTNFLRGAEKSGFGRRRREGKGREGKEGPPQRKHGRYTPNTPPSPPLIENQRMSWCWRTDRSRNSSARSLRTSFPFKF